MIKFPQPNARENVLLARLELLGTTISVSRTRTQACGTREAVNRQGIPPAEKTKTGEKTAETQ